ncbi:MAG: hypothetical protein ACM30H_13150 [Clostridia bacterium]
MLGFTHLRCTACRALQPLCFSHLVPGLPALGISVECQRCRRVAFTLIEGRSAFCPACETITAVRAAECSLPGKVYACCARCDGLFTVLESDPQTSERR